MSAPKKLEAIRNETWALNGDSPSSWGEFLIVHDAGAAFDLVKRGPTETLSIRLTRGDALGLHELLRRFLGLDPAPQGFWLGLRWDDGRGRARSALPSTSAGHRSEPEEALVGPVEQARPGEGACRVSFLDELFDDVPMREADPLGLLPRKPVLRVLTARQRFARLCLIRLFANRRLKCG